MITSTLLCQLNKKIFYNSKASFSLLTQKLNLIIPQRQAELKELKSKYKDKIIDKYTVDQLIGGMRSMKTIVWDGSSLDPVKGITFRGYTITELKKLLPKARYGEEPLPEAVYWLLLTGYLPSKEEYSDFAAELQSRSHMHEDDLKFIENLPKFHHPMTMLSLAILYFQHESSFANAYKSGVPKSEYWKFIHEDSLNLLAKLPTIAAYIYRIKYKNSQFIPPDFDLDWSANYAHMLGYDSNEVRECLRGYLSIHSDHEGGNVSAHASHLVGSALSDPYLSFSAAVNGLAGPLHGLANQEYVRFLLGAVKELGDQPTDEQLKDYVQNHLREGRVVPGYGHAVLRSTDPRFLHQKEFADKYIKNDPLVKLTHQCFRLVPGILEQLGKVKNPNPNVDAHSGVLLYHYDIKEFEYYTVIFAVSRALGCLSNLVWSRALNYPIERPGSVDLDWFDEKFGGKQQAAQSNQ